MKKMVVILIIVIVLALALFFYLGGPGIFIGEECEENSDCSGDQPYCDKLVNKCTATESNYVGLND